MWYHAIFGHMFEHPEVQEMFIAIVSPFFLPIGSMYGIYANIGGILMVKVTIYSSTMDPMGYVFRWSWLGIASKAKWLCLRKFFGSKPPQLLGGESTFQLWTWWILLGLILYYLGITLWLCQNSYWKLAFIVDLPSYKMLIFHSYVSLPEGIGD